ncbi:glucosamine 6-phosphate synthetase, contains amidotransferase and phosphosugar isomerase domains [Saccharomonospora xinjiangensis XJ-54]|uniref:Glucosamine 6-phosphate synthetase, contains amidotransferase and phosphosugar isomerase domains n=2 Tax=Saccharomonospora TaxID=1851 RepID=I0V3Z7_9PSEU|nr:glucosamine 6-phosphate synthetase, contains amidotransferase and phosphosugar isomerase domains [Saccharomonospora xinjiangensis XJ-54]
MNDTASGRHMAAEVAQQPAVLAGLVQARSDIASVASRIAERPPRFALLAARGSSDHAAIYAKYLVEVLLGLPAGLVSPSTTTLYHAEQDLSDVLLISVSQSGGSYDLLEVTQTARARGALTVAVTNTPSSPLTEAAELSVDVRAGTENAVAATKTYSATLLALYLLVDAIRGGKGEHVADIGELAERTLADTEDDVARAVERYRFADRILTTARGYSFATALEGSLKLAETSYLSTRAYSGADLLHGPVAAVDTETAVLGVTSAGKGGAALLDVLDTVSQRGADVLCVGSAARSVPSAALTVPIAETAEEVAPILEVLPLQRLALGLALARGYDPDSPRGLRKVTRTR